MKELLPPLDQAFSALLEDLHQRGLLESTIVTWFGEFGRTPKVDPKPPWDNGRHHYGPVNPVVVAGGGFKGGVVVGATDAKGEFPASAPSIPGTCRPACTRCWASIRRADCPTRTAVWPTSRRSLRGTFRAEDC